MYGLSWVCGAKAEAVFQLRGATVTATDLDFEVHWSQGDMAQSGCANGIEASDLNDFGEKLLGVKKPKNLEGFAGVIVG